MSTAATTASPEEALRAFLLAVERALIGAAWGRLGVASRRRAKGTVPRSPEEADITAVYPDPESWPDLVAGLLDCGPAQQLAARGHDPAVLLAVEVLRAEWLALGPDGGLLRPGDRGPSPAWVEVAAALAARPTFDAAAWEQDLWRRAAGARRRAVAGSEVARRRYGWLREALTRAGNHRSLTRTPGETFRGVPTDGRRNVFGVLGAVDPAELTVRRVVNEGAHHEDELEIVIACAEPVEVRVIVRRGEHWEHALFQRVSGEEIFSVTLPAGATDPRVQLRAWLDPEVPR